MLEDPSNGSITAMYFPLKSSSTATGISSSSDATIPVRPEFLRQLQKTSLETCAIICDQPHVTNYECFKDLQCLQKFQLTTSSFFWSSPCTLVSPARPVREEIPARLTREAICLHAVAIEVRTTTSSLSILPSASCSQSHIKSIFSSRASISSLENERWPDLH